MCDGLPSIIFFLNSLNLILILIRYAQAFGVEINPLAFPNHLSTLSVAPRPPNRGGVSDVSRSPCLFGVCEDNETIPYWSYDTTLGGKVGWGAVRTDNEGQTLADFRVVAVGGWCLEATAAGGST